MQSAPDSSPAPMRPAPKPKIGQTRLNGRMLPPRLAERRCALPRPVRQIELALLRQRIQCQPRVQRLAVLFAVKAPVKTAGIERRIRCLHRVDQRHRHVHVRAFPQYSMRQDELVLILHQRHRQAQLRQHPRLPLADPARVRLVDRKHLLLVRYLLPFQNPPIDLVRQQVHILQKVANLGLRLRRVLLFGQGIQQRPGPRSVLLAQPHVRLHTLAGNAAPSAPGCTPGIPSACGPHACANIKGCRGACARPDQTPRRIPQQPHIGRKVHIRLNIATTAQRGPR